MKLTKKYKAIVYVTNLYSILQFMLLNEEKLDDVLFINHFKFAEKSNLETWYLKKEMGYRFLNPICIYWICLWNRKASIFLSGENLYTNYFLRIYKNVSYLDEGTASYLRVNEPYRQVVRSQKSMIRNLLMGPLYPWFGLADNAINVYLTGIFPIPSIIKDKVELINLKSLWIKKTVQQQKEILHIFNLDSFNLELIKKYNTLLITQPFSEMSNGRISEKEKIDIYRKLLSEYKEEKVLIKTHPGERTDYAIYFPNACVLNIPCPLELFMLVNCHINRAITVYSTAIFHLDNQIEKIIAGYNVSPVLEEEAKIQGWKML